VLAVMSILPPGARRRLESALGREHGVMRLDPASRRAYEERAGRNVTGTHTR
jgi:hypothetical protein